MYVCSLLILGAAHSSHHHIMTVDSRADVVAWFRYGGFANTFLLTLSLCDVLLYIQMNWFKKLYQV
jgi:hypothetical protein